MRTTGTGYRQICADARLHISDDTELVLDLPLDSTLHKDEDEDVHV